MVGPWVRVRGPLHGPGCIVGPLQGPEPPETGPQTVKHSRHVLYSPVSRSCRVPCCAESMLKLAMLEVNVLYHFARWLLRVSRCCNRLADACHKRANACLRRPSKRGSESAGEAHSRSLVKNPLANGVNDGKGLHVGVRQLYG